MTVITEAPPLHAPRRIDRRRDRNGIERAGDRLLVCRATLAILSLGLAWRVIRYALRFPVWGDEAYVAVTLLERDFAGLARPPEFFQIVPPGFLWIEWLAGRWLGPEEWALRLIPFLAGVASLGLFWRFCRRTTTRRTTLVAAAILAASFYPVRHAAEIKPYATDLLISLVLTSLSWAVYRRIDSVRRWLALIVATTAGLWCSYPAVFSVATVAVVLGARAVSGRARGAVLLWIAFLAAALASWCPMYALFAGPQARGAAFLADSTTWRDAFPPIGEPGRLPGWLMRVHTGLMLAYPQGGHDFGSTATTLLVIAGAIRMSRKRARRPLLLLLLGPLVPAMAAASLHRYPYGTSTRVMLYMAPAFCLLAAEGLMLIFRLRRRTDRGPILAAAALAAFPIGGIAHDVIRPYTGFDNVIQRRLARRLAGLVRPRDAVIVFNGVTPPPSIPDLMITRWLQRVAVARYDLESCVPAPIAWEPEPRTVSPGPGGRLWFLVQRHGDEQFFPEDRLVAYESALAICFGPPQFFDRHDLPNGESWTITVYPGPRRP